MKIRWSQRCAGGCGLWLKVGAHAVHAHRGYWCPACWARHAPDCQAHRTTLQPAPAEHEPDLLDLLTC